MIHDSAGRRPIYFASSAGLLRLLGLEPFGVRHGLATKLVMRDPQGDAPDGWVEGSARMGGGWFDIERSMTLVRDVYRYRGLKDRELWQDRSTLSIPTLYQFLFVQLADVAAYRSPVYRGGRRTRRGRSLDAGHRAGGLPVSRAAVTAVAHPPPHQSRDVA